LTRCKITRHFRHSVDKKLIFENQIITMKKLFTAMLFAAAAQGAQAQMLPNGNFETWTGSGTSVQIGGGWFGNGLLRFENLQVNTQNGTEWRLPADGRYFVGIRNVVSGTTGSLGFIGNRFAFNARPASLRTAIMYFPGSVSGESWGFRVMFLKNAMGGGKDTILNVGGVMQPTGVGNWAQFTVGLTANYNPAFPTETPDTAMVIFQLLPNSNSQISAQGLLALDIVTFTEYNLGSRTFALDAVSDVHVFPNPSAGSPVHLNFVNGMKGHGKVEIFNMQGQLVKTLFDGTMEPGQHSLKVSSGELAKGMYIYRLTHEGGVKEGKFAIQ
jgi:hypothetical protein